MKWTALQERTISKEHPFEDASNETPEAYAARVYLQFLWLPESIMSLRYLVPSFLRIRPVQTTSPAAPHPLHDALRPLLLTPRTASQKYHTRISQILDEDGGSGDAEEAMMWFAYKHEKIDEENPENPEETEMEAEERWKNSWLEKMERREVQVQVLLLFLLLSLPGAPAPTGPMRSAPALPPSLSPSKIKKRKRRGSSPVPPPMSMQDRLESFMDKMSMWQLMSSIDEEEAKRAQGGRSDAKGKQKAVDERDWMQIFCEDVVEPKFRSSLPDFCDLLRSKVFQTSPFSDDSDSLLSPSPPPSPRQKNKRLKSAASASSSKNLSMPAQRAPRAHAESTYKAQDLQRSRSRSLSVSLEEERARSRSASIGTGNLRRQLLSREVSMTTAFKGKIKAREREQARQAAARAKTVRDETRKTIHASAAAHTKSSKGVTLVAATPVKPKTQQRREAAQRDGASQLRPSRIPSPLAMRSLEGIVDDSDEEDWTLPSSPAVLTLPNSSHNVDVLDYEDEGHEKDSRMLLAGTPTKPPRDRAR